MNDEQKEIIEELYKSLHLLGAGSDLLGTVGSIGDTIPDSLAINLIKDWNAAKIAETKEIIELVSGDNSAHA